MSIVALSRVTVYGKLDEKEMLLEALQEMGCIHLLPLRADEGAAGVEKVSPQAKEAIRFLLECPNRGTQVSKSSTFDGALVEQEALELREGVLTLEDRVDFLKKRLENLRPWGEFEFVALEQLAGVRLWFYVVPHNKLESFDALELPRVEIGHDHRFSYIVILSEEEPQGLSVERVRTGAKSLSKLEEELEEVQLELEDLQARRWKLTRWCKLFAQNLHVFENKADLEQAKRITHDDSPVFVLQGWAPKEKEEELVRFAHSRGAAVTFSEPSADEKPPTYMRNKPMVAGGEELVKFYQTPSYWLWDPSGIVFYSFALFFGMILADAGYGAILLLGLLFVWKKMGTTADTLRMRRLFAVIVAACIFLNGIIIGSYFGVSPAEDSVLGSLKLLDMNDSNAMMFLTISIGIAHVIYASLSQAFCQGFSRSSLVPLGWVGLFAGGFCVWIEYLTEAAFFGTLGYVLMGIGAVMVFLYSAPDAPLLWRILGGLNGLVSRISGAFGDVLSYLRLFALGLASGSLALTFNQMAGDVREAVPGLGVLIAFVVLMFGHSVNFLLGLVSGVVHGLRLNVIEFFNWGVPEEGYPFRAFRKKEGIKWTQ